MVFNSLTFLVFFVAVLALHNLPLPWRVKKFNLLWASYVFYAAWNPPFVLVLMLSTVIDWFAAKGIYHAKTVLSRRVWLATTLGVNLGALGLFKYGNFLLSNSAGLLNTLGLHYHLPRLDIILPIGISFYTFVTLSYTLDVYWGRMKPWDSFLDYAMFVTFFPHLVAGPILRAADFLPQCREPRRPTREEFAWALSLLILGLFEKIVVADYLLAPVAETVFGADRALGFADAWIGTLAFAGQIFCDFAGYSTCAIAIARCLGFWLPQNFKNPYAALGFSDFWRRWHISLSTWLRDYLYIPLGGNRRGEIRTYMNLLVTMLIGGLWHGASWLFVVWGGLHGIYLSGERLLKRFVTGKELEGRAPVQVIIATVTFALICFTWVFFRSRTFDQAFGLASSMLGAGSGNLTAVLSIGGRLRVLLPMILILCIHWNFRDSTIETVVQRAPEHLRSIAVCLMLIAILFTPGEDRAFIYFQF